MSEARSHHPSEFSVDMYIKLDEHLRTLDDAIADVNDAIDAKRLRLPRKRELIRLQEYRNMLLQRRVRTIDMLEVAFDLPPGYHKCPHIDVDEESTGKSSDDEASVSSIEVPMSDDEVSVSSQTEKKEA